MDGGMAFEQGRLLGVQPDGGYIFPSVSMLCLLWRRVADLSRAVCVSGGGSKVEAGGEGCWEA